MATAVKERPILFSGSMVRAILGGRKTQTRRLIKPQPDSPCVMAEEFTWVRGRPTCIWPAPYTLDDGSRPDHHAVCPYGSPGDRLWVRESFLPCRLSAYGLASPRDAGYVCFCDGAQMFRSGSYYPQPESIGEPRPDSWPDWAKWSPSIHMPRWASRLTLEVTGVRVERLNGISEADARAEGCDGDCPVGYIPAYEKAPVAYHFAQLWESINGPGSWDANPWVWVVEFRRIEGGEA